MAKQKAKKTSAEALKVGGPTIVIAEGGARFLRGLTWVHGISWSMKGRAIVSETGPFRICSVIGFELKDVKFRSLGVRPVGTYHLPLGTLGSPLSLAYLAVLKPRRYVCWNRIDHLRRIYVGLKRAELPP